MRVLTIEEMDVVAGGCGAPKVKKPKKSKCKGGSKSGKGSSSGKSSGKGSSSGKKSGKASSGKGCLPPPPPPCEVFF